ncbi:MAG: hypothetical protein M3R13_01725 [Armatimonadota bacterium]|nr:hypothetical protein [Armatimonadota bacterium]
MELVSRIREAFPDPGWPADKLATLDADYSCFDTKYVRDHYQGSRWSELTAKELGWMSQDGWAFNDEAMLYFLPAWMIDDLLRDHDHLAQHKLGRHLEQRRRYICDHTTREQQEVILDFFVFTCPGRDEFSEPAVLISELFERSGRVDERT